MPDDGTIFSRTDYIHLIGGLVGTSQVSKKGAPFGPLAPLGPWALSSIGYEVASYSTLEI